MLQDQIIDASLQSLRNEGLRFSVDSLAARLKISKKTIYKYFPTKEALALAMYDRYYDLAASHAAALCAQPGPPRISELLQLYCDARYMVRGEIFNKYKLNDVLQAHTARQSERLWQTISGAFPGPLTPEEQTALRIAVEGAVDRLIEAHISPDSIIERLVKLVC